jgi:hypothetical protein
MIINGSDTVIMSADDATALLRLIDELAGVNTKEGHELRPAVAPQEGAEPVSGYPLWVLRRRDAAAAASAVGALSQLVAVEQARRPRPSGGA